MTILNEAEISALNDSRFADNTTGLITPAILRAHNTDTLESLQSYGGVMSDAGVQIDDISITGTATKLATFGLNSTSANALLEADHANDLLKVFEPALYFVTFRFYGQWPAGEDLKFDIRVNGATNPITPVIFEQEGQGASDPVIISVTDIAMIVNSSMIAAGPGGLEAEIELYVSSDTGTFTVDQIGITMGAEYNPLSIRTVG